MTTLGKYKILEEIGRGGFAVVYKARDTTLDRPVALKVLHPQLTIDPKFLQRFHQEARTAARLNHSNIATVYEVGEEDGQHYLAMVYLPGQTLDQRMTEGPLPLAQVVSIVEQLADALDAIHARGLVHRDVKPGNVIVDDAGHATLLDFGIVRAAEGTRLTTTMTVLGTPEYMSPEQAEGQDPDYRSDLYALGVLAYQMCTGQVPFSAPSPLAVLRFQADKAPPLPRELNPQLSAKVEGVLLKALAKAREARYQRAGDLAQALRAAVEGEAQARQRERRLQARYGQLHAAVAGQDWTTAEALAREILTLAPEYQDVPELWARAREALARQQKQDQLHQLYQQLQASTERENWARVLELGEQRRGLAPGYRDVATLVERARAQSERPTRATRPQGRAQEPFPKEVWIGVGTVVVVLVIIVALMVRGGGEDGGIATSTHTPTLTPTDTPTPTPELTLDLGSTITRERDDAVMVYVPGGTFRMGNTDAEVDRALEMCNEERGDCKREWFEDEQLAHTVTLDSFWIDRYEVSNAQYAAFMNAQGNQLEGGTTWLEIESDDCLIEQAGDTFRPKAGYDQHPVIEVSWYGARAYCEWVGARLPTEAEWEYAARGPEGNVYPWGDTFDCTRGNFDDETKVDDYVVSGRAGCDGYDRTAPVGSFESGRSWCGVYDMAGNVWEWVADWYGEYPSQAQTNPTGPETGGFKVLRGGGWSNRSYRVRSAYRIGSRPSDRISVNGFRCVGASTSSLSQ